MRISDWSSDVCSSDLAEAEAFEAVNVARKRHGDLAQRAAAVASRLAALEETLARLGGDVEENEATLAQAREEQAGLPDLNLAHQRADELREAVTAARSAIAEECARRRGGEKRVRQCR